MGIKKLSPITPGQRHRIAPTYDEITKSKPEKGLVVFLKERGGRNNTGKMTMRYRGGGNKRMYRLIDFKRDKHGIPATVKAIEYDPYRSARIALLFYADGEKRYIIAPDKVEVGQVLYNGPSVAPDNGNCLPLRMIPLGTIVHNVELKVGKGGQLVRSAGTGAQLLARDDKYATLKMPSGEMRMVLVDCNATVGVVSNQEHLNTSKGKAGRNRWLGVRPRTRGVAMNPVDHPMGGGEGKSSGGHPRSRKGLYAKGKKTRTPNKYSDRMILSKKK